jgi:phage terminase large subunit-like protein
LLATETLIPRARAPRPAQLTEKQLRRLTRPDRERYLETAKRWLELVKLNPLLAWEPYESPRRPGFAPQHEYLMARTEKKAFFGGNGSGKSDIGTIDDLIQLLSVEDVPEHLRVYKHFEPPFFMRVTAPTNGVLESTVLEKFRQYTPRSALRGGTFDKAYSKQQAKLHFANGSWVLFNTNEQERSAHAGVELHRSRFDEEPDWHIYMENAARIRAFADGHLAFTMTPSLKGTLGWTYDEIYEHRDEDDTFVTFASMLDNPHVYGDKILKLLANASDAERAAMIEGKFIAFHGRVLHQFTADHVIDPPTIEHVRQLTTYIGIDPGIRRGGVVWCGIDRDGVLLVYDELYPDSVTIPDLARQIKQRNAYWKVTQPIYVMDPAGRTRDLVNAETVEGALNQQGIYPTPGQNDRVAGVMQMRARVESRSLIVSKGCQNVLKEIDRWVVADDEVSGEGSKKIKGSGGSFATVGPDHLMDPIRYVCMERPWFIRPKETAERWSLQSGRAPTLKEIGQLQKAATGPMGKFS